MTATSTASEYIANSNLASSSVKRHTHPYQ
jgi:hypothetical protein